MSSAIRMLIIARGWEMGAGDWEEITTNSNPQPLSPIPRLYRNSQLDHCASPAGRFQPGKLSTNQPSSIAHVIDSAGATQIGRHGHATAIIAHSDQQTSAFAK